jgi:putative flavoprotein involved in K+ transport
VRDVRDGRLIIAPDLKETLVEVDQFEIDTLKMVDEYIVRVGLPAPPETVPQLRDGYEQEVITELNLEWAGISTTIWAIGYSFDFSFVKLPGSTRKRFCFALERCWWWWGRWQYKPEQYGTL